MKTEKPILMCGEMVRATLRAVDPKTQTRRVVKDRGPWSGGGEPTVHAEPNGELKVWKAARVDYSGFVECPYGQSGNRLWVRETFARVHDGLLQRLDPEPDNGEPWNNGWSTVFRADGLPANWEHYGLNWKPSIFMPRKLSRIDLEIVKIRLERVQDISEADARAEGIKRVGNVFAADWEGCDQGGRRGTVCGSARLAYQGLWNAINLKPSPLYEKNAAGKKVIVSYVSYPWSLEDFEAQHPGVARAGTYRGKPLVIAPNPWVWVIEFKRI